MKEALEKRPPSLPIYLRLEKELVHWLDREARRQRRSRAYVVGQACRLLLAVRQHTEKEDAE